MALLQCASEVSELLSKMTTAKSRHHQQQQQQQQQHGIKSDGQDNDNNNLLDNNKSKQELFEQLSAQVRSNGVGYLAGVNKLHELLAPHAALVKSYRNHHHQSAAVNPNNDIRKKGSAASSTVLATGGSNNDGKQQQQSSSSEIASFTGSASDIVKMATSNMYAARVEKRLAVERKEILKEMIRLEEEELLEGSVVGDDEDDAKSNKRKR